MSRKDYTPRALAADDQASARTVDEMHLLSEKHGWDLEEHEPTSEDVDRLLRAIDRRTKYICSHMKSVISEGPPEGKPVQIHLSLKFMACGLCYDLMLYEFKKEAMATPDEWDDGTCDLCGEPSKEFNAFSIGAGPMIVHGLICDACAYTLS